MTDHDRAGTMAAVQRPKPTATPTVRTCIPGKSDLLAILQKGAGFAGKKRKRRRTAPADLRQAAIIVLARRRDRPGSRQVARAQAAAVGGMMGDDPCDSPAHIARQAAAQDNDAIRKPAARPIQLVRAGS